MGWPQLPGPSVPWATEHQNPSLSAHRGSRLHTLPRPHAFCPPPTAQAHESSMHLSTAQVITWLTALCPQASAGLVLAPLWEPIRV